MQIDCSLLPQESFPGRLERILLFVKLSPVRNCMKQITPEICTGVPGGRHCFHEALGLKHFEVNLCAYGLWISV